MLGAGQRSQMIRIERQRVTDDGAGNVLASWDDPLLVCRVSAAFVPQYGREAVEAGRLESTMAGTVTVLRSSLTTGITAADRIVFERAPYAGRIANIRSVVPSPDSAEIGFVVEVGVAT